MCRVPVGTHQWLLIITALRHERCCSRSVATPFMACTVLFISHPFGVVCISPLLSLATTIMPPPRVPFFRGVRRSRGVSILNQMPKVLISGSRYLCWLRQRDTYSATVVAPLSKGDAAAVPLVSTFSIYSKRQADRHRASPLL